MAAKKETENLKATQKKQTASKKPSDASSGSGKKNTGKTAKAAEKESRKRILDFPFADEIIVWGSLALCIILFVSNFGIGGFVGNAISSFFFGMFGLMAYLFPVLFFLGVSFLIINKKNALAWMKTAAALLLLICICCFIELVTNQYDVTREFSDFYVQSSKLKNGGGLAGGVIAALVCPAFGLVGAYVLIIVLGIISMVLITERSLFQGVRKTGRKVYENAREDAKLRKERAAIREEKQQIIRSEYRRMRRERLEAEKKELEKLPEELRKKREAMSVDHALDRKKGRPEEVHEIIPPLQETKPVVNQGTLKIMDFDMQGQTAEMTANKREEASPKLPFVTTRLPEPEILDKEDFDESAFNVIEQRPSFFEEQLRENGEMISLEEMESEEEEVQEEMIHIMPVETEDDLAEDIPEEVPAQKASETPAGEHRVKNPKSSKEEQQKAQEDVMQEMEEAAKVVKPEYVFPPIDLLSQPQGGKNGNADKELKETAMKLQQTLKNFGVNVHVTNASCGPVVTRYELTPEQGVKVSRIVSLADDIKLNLAAADIRIEAPIPGKAAVGIEVPNKTNSAVPIRELLESREFKEHASSLAFAVGKGIDGKVVVSDIGKMPHLLIAGATGSGKSVCINTIIMSILYKSKPEDVKLIMIDPKVVELSVYNGIPHLLIPVVTDPKKASGALNWAVAEMMVRYEKFSNCKVRNIQEYNKKVEMIQDVPGENKPEKMAKIVIIVDELADLMMVAPGEVEDAICRLAQLARAAGIHLIIATQRPSVNVITGLIKANMPSRIAFAVTSGIDSRTILDMVGAEKLLGKGDMLYYPQGYTKPARVQGAFVSDSEVESVVGFLTSENSGAVYSADIEEQISQAKLSGGAEVSGESDIDEYFEKAGRFIIDKDKASIGMLQRVLKIGFNRAARIMDQLADAGVVGPEEGTKPRKVLMSMEQFEDYLSEYI